MQDYPNNQQPIRLPGSVRVVVGGLMVGLLLVSCVAVALIPVLASQQGADAQQERAFQALFAALFALLGLLLLLTERQLRAIGWTRAPVSFGRLMVTTGAGLTFWTGLALFGIALARLEVPDMAGPLNIAFWALAALWLAGEVVLTARHFWRPRRVRAPGRWE